MEFNLKNLFASPSIRAVAEMIVSGPGWGIGSSGHFPGLQPPQAALIDRTATGELVKASYATQQLTVNVTYEKLAAGKVVRLSGTITNEQAVAVRCDRPRPLALMLKVDPSARVRTCSLKGGIGGSMFPPPSFSFAVHELTGPATYIDFDSGRGGYSTNNDMPYLVVQVDDIGGLFWALEWPGAWWACVNRLQEDPRDIWLEAGPIAAVRDYKQYDQIDIMLEPGESIPLPACVIGLYRGDQRDGCNALRRFIASQIPLLDGRRLVPPVSYNHFFGLGLDCSDEQMRRQADAAARIGVEYFVNDAGWYDGSARDGLDFMRGTGNWRSENRNKYPQGLDALAQYVEQLGMKFGIWMGMENCAADSLLAREHPQWVIPIEPGEPSMVGTHCLVDLGQGDAVEWFKETIDLIFPRFHVQWLRWDLNIYPEPCWLKNDPPARRGVTQIRHVQGLLELWDYILSNYPRVCIEACCGGGRRMDLACLRRAHTYWCNDETRRPHLQRWENTGANHFLPGNFLNRNICYDGNGHYPPWYYHSLMGGTLSFGDRLAQWDDQGIETAAKHVAVYKQIRHLLMHDYYPLFGQAPTLDQWDGWQFHDPQADEGVVFCFRCLSGQETVRIRLRNLHESAAYDLTDPYTGEARTCRGGELTSAAMKLTLDVNGSRVLRYRRQSRS